MADRSSEPAAIALALDAAEITLDNGRRDQAEWLLMTARDLAPSLGPPLDRAASAAAVRADRLTDVSWEGVGVDRRAVTENEVSMKTIWSCPPARFGLLLVTLICLRTPTGLGAADSQKPAPGPGAQNRASGAPPTREVPWAKPVALKRSRPSFRPGSTRRRHTGGRVIDGTGNAWFYGDIALGRWADRAGSEPAGMLEPPHRRTSESTPRDWSFASGFHRHSGVTASEGLLTGDGRRRSKVSDQVDHDRDPGRRLVKRPGE